MFFDKTENKMYFSVLPFTLKKYPLSQSTVISLKCCSYINWNKNNFKEFIFIKILFFLVIHKHFKSPYTYYIHVFSIHTTLMPINMNKMWYNAVHNVMTGNISPLFLQTLGMDFSELSHIHTLYWLLLRHITPKRHM